MTLAFCWSHMRRDFVECAAGQVRLTGWCQGWIERIASIYRLNEARLEHHDPVIKRQTPAFDAGQGALKAALDGLFAEAECPSSKQMGLLSVFHKGGSGSSLFDVKPLGVDGSSGGFGWSVF